MYLSSLATAYEQAYTVERESQSKHAHATAQHEDRLLGSVVIEDADGLDARCNCTPLS
jgi:hypothetical protein